MGVAYAQRRDLYTYGLPRGTLGHSARLLASVEADTDILELDGHGLEDDDQVLVRASEGGTLSAPLAEGTIYFVRRLSDSTFKLSATEGGAAINLTTDGASMIVMIALPLDALLELYSRFVDNFTPAHAVPLTAPFPVQIVATVATLAAKHAQHIAGVSSISMKEEVEAARLTLKEWAKGLPLRDAAVTTTATNLAISGSTVSAVAASSCSSGFKGSIP